MSTVALAERPASTVAPAPDPLLELALQAPRALDEAGLARLAADLAAARAALIEQWCRDTAEPGMWFDAAAADAAVAFYPRYCRHLEGEWAGQPFELSAWQRVAVRMAYGWKRADGTRRFRHVLILIPRKNGKTTFCGATAILMLVGDEEMHGQVYAVANDEGQAKLVFEKAGFMIGQSAELSELFEVYKDSIYCSALFARFQPLSSRPRGKHGFHPSGRIGDEIHEMVSGELIDVVHKGMAGRRQPLEIDITTSGVRGQGYGFELYERAVKVWLGEIRDPAFLPIVFAAPDDADWTDPRIWALANPNLGISPKIDFIAKEARDAAESPRKENNFRRYHLNQWTEQVTRWLAMTDWRQCRGPADWRELEALLAGRRCHTGVDLSIKRDLSAVVHVFPTYGDDGRPLDEGPWFILPRFWLPRAVLEPGHLQLNARQKDDYRRWAEAGALALTDGDIIDQRAIEARILEDAKRFRIVDLPYDPYNATQFALNLRHDHGLEAVEFNQTVKNYNEPTKKFEALVLAHALAHGGHPVLAWMAQNAAVYTEPKSGNIKPDKFAGGQIDGIVAAVMALGRAIVPAEAAPEPQVIALG